MHIEIVSVQAITPLLALIFGILILILPKFLNNLVAIYLIIIGLVGRSMRNQAVSTRDIASRRARLREVARSPVVAMRPPKPCRE